MSAVVVLRHLLLVLAAAGLVGAGIRLGSLLAPAGLERLLAAFTFAATGAVLEAIGLGLAGVGGDTVALTVASLATFTLARAVVPRPELGPSSELMAWLREAAPRVWLGVGGAAGIALAWVVWQLRHPLIGPDALTYHLPIASAWVQNGRPGSVVEVLNGLPFGSYPLTNEVLVGWALGISRSWVAVSVWSPVLWVAVAAGGWVTLRELGAGAAERSLAVVALGVPPLMIGQLGATYTDIAALAWLAVAAGLATAARRRPGLVYPAVLAGALCVGTKTTPAVLVVALAAVAARPLREARRGWLLATLAAAAAVGGIWSVRDLLEHGSPLWPLVSGPLGDPIPSAFISLQGRFLDHPRHLLGAYWRDYLAVLGGGAVLIGSGLVLPLLRRSRAALGAAGAAAAALLAWGAAPYTGVEGYGAAGAIANTRYLLPAIAACSLALAVSARGAGRGMRLAVWAALAASIAYSLVKTAAFGPLRPSLATLTAAAVLGMLGAALVRRSPPAVDPRLVAAGLCLAAAIGLAVGAHGYVERYLAADHPPDHGLYALAARAPAAAPITSAPGVFVLLRGDRLEHPLGLIGDGETCASVRRRLARGPVVLTLQPDGPAHRRLTACLRGVRPTQVGAYEAVYGLGGG